MPKAANKSELTDWKRLRAMTDAEAEANALSDPDNQPLSKEAMAGMSRRSRVAVIRRALRLTQEEFSTRYQIPLGTLRDWEQGRSEPDQPTRAYLRVIAAEPDMTAKALAGRSAA